jgi:hypothetical protein
VIEELLLSVMLSHLVPTIQANLVTPVITPLTPPPQAPAVVFQPCSKIHHIVLIGSWGINWRTVIQYCFKLYL